MHEQLGTRSETDPAKARGFDAVMGARRGARRFDLSAAQPDAGSCAYAVELGLAAFSGAPAEALRELRLAGEDAREMPLLRELQSKVVRSIGFTVALHAEERREFCLSLGINGAAPIATPSPFSLYEAVRLELHQQLASGSVEERFLREAARTLHIAAFARGLAVGAAQNPGSTIRQIFGEKEAHRLAAGLPGPPAPRHGRICWAGGLVSEDDWQGLFVAALTTSEPAEKLREQIRALVSDLAHECASN